MIALVMVIFRTIDDRKIAATVAGALFVGLPLGLMIYEKMTAGFAEKIWYAGTLQFWVLFALPILGLRIFNWGTEFSELTFLGIPGPFLHQWSSKSYMVWMLITLFTSWKVARARMKEE
ncbi:hypothetical protein D3C87_241600 [compost metagenome]